MAVYVRVQAGSAFKDLTAEHVDPQYKSRAALLIAALQRCGAHTLVNLEKLQYLQLLCLRMLSPNQQRACR